MSAVTAVVARGALVRVDLESPTRELKLSPSEARDLAGQLMRAATEAERA